MLQIKNVTIAHKKDLRTIMKDVSLTLNPGDRMVVIGEEGNGKSTLLRWIYDPALVESYVDAVGERILGNERLAWLPQELPCEYSDMSVYDYFTAEPSFWEHDQRDLAVSAGELELPKDVYYSDELMSSLSGGEKVKIQMLRLMLQQPTVLLLDEPSNDIDITTLEWLEKLINAFKGAVLFISHDEILIERTANCVLHLEMLHRKQECRHTVAKLSYTEYVRRRADALDKQAQQAQSDLREKRKRDEKFRRIYQRVEFEQATISRQDPHGGRLLKKSMHKVKSMEKRFSKEDEKMTQKPVFENAIDFKLGAEAIPLAAGKTVLDFRLGELRTPGKEGPDSPNSESGRLLAKNIELLVRGPEKICIIGPNGCGKTTLLRRIAAELGLRKDLRAEYMPQNYGELLDMAKTPVENICRSGDAEERTMVRTYLGALRFTTAEMEHPTGELSGGQQAKIFLLRMNTSGANVLILDEPTRNFSPLSGPVVRGMLKSFPGAIISVSHDRRFISEVFEKVYRLDASGLILQKGME